MTKNNKGKTIKLNSAVKLNKGESLLQGSTYLCKTGKVRTSLINFIVKKDDEKFRNDKLANWYGKVIDGDIQFFYMVSRKKGVCTVSLSYFLAIDDGNVNDVTVKRFVSVFMYVNGFTTMSGFRTFTESVTDVRHVVPCFTLSNKEIAD